MTNTIYTFFQKVSIPITVQQYYNRLPKISAQTAGKVAGVAAAIFALCYAVYKVYRSLTNRANVLDSTPSQVTNAQADDDALSTSDVTSSQASDSEYFSCNEEKEPFIIDDQIAPFLLTPVANKTVQPSPIEKLKALFPGKHIQCNTKNGLMNLADFLMSTLLPLDQSESCSIDDDGTFTINFKEDKVFSFSTLPEIMLAPLAWYEKQALNAFLYIAPGIQISKTIQGKIVAKDNHTDIELNADAIFLMQNRWGYTAHLNFIRVYNDPTDNGYYVFIQGEHNSDKIPHKQGIVDHDIFAQVIELNLPQNLV